MRERSSIVRYCGFRYDFLVVSIAVRVIYSDNCRFKDCIKIKIVETMQYSYTHTQK